MKQIQKISAEKELFEEVFNVYLKNNANKNITDIKIITETVQRYERYTAFVFYEEDNKQKK
ncbi:hypothetical protein SFC55_20350 [Niallia taxi]|uniref:hypothetical protein n=1 Tax=Niallia taxi TaxID=2499688 RepID=UPI003982D6C7